MLKSFSAMILAAGFGKRMLHLTKNIPKPLITINNTSLLKNNIDFLFKIGCTKIIVNTHYKHDLIINFVNIDRLKNTSKPRMLVNATQVHMERRSPYFYIKLNQLGGCLKSKKKYTMASFLLW